ncbi:hypothetical protein [Streptomyces sp. TLI_185]|uniref:hypothetical protein n=1 Tax=Streptomyces sp. TLI_185 TaxID=2485151 RepID=UPI000F4DBED7|nr:hypothetical protein [Streptomyces sp. TLI_185]RPF34210.1 hypothetical protein EDD92_4155 [Streptomyces sp. TLI_185]
MSLPVRRVPRLLVTLSAAAVAVTGCSVGGGTTHGASEPEVSAIPVLTDSADLALPLDAYEATPEERQLLVKAQQVLTTRCMDRLGFDYQQPQQSGAAKESPNSRLYGVTDPATAARYGYRSPEETQSGATRAKAEPLSKAEETALFGAPDLRPAELPKSQQEAERESGDGGVPVGGCTRESFLKLYAPDPKSVDVLYVFQLKSEAQTRARTDSRTEQVNARWSACMAKSGYQAKEPMKAAEELGFTDAELAGPEAITAATVDVACKKKTNLVGTYYAVQSAYQRRLVEEHAETLNLARQQLRDRLRLAASLIS